MRRLAARLAAVCLAATVTACGGGRPGDPGSGPATEDAAPVATRVATRALPAVGESAIRDLADGGPAIFAVELAADEYLAVDVVQEGIDATLLWRAPGAPAVEIDSPTGTRYAEVLRVVASSAGPHRLEIHGRPPPEGGRVRIVTRARRLPATPRDRSEAAGVAALLAGRSLRLERRWSEALERYRRAQRHLAAAGVPALEAEAWHRIARARVGEGRHGDAVQPLERAIELAAHPRRITWLWLELGDARANADDHRRAVEAYDTVLARLDESGAAEPGYRGSAELGRGYSLRQLGRLHDAWLAFHRGLAVCRDRPELAALEAEMRNHLSRLLLELGRPELARRQARRGLAALAEAGVADAEKERQLLTTLGILDRDAGDWTAARAHFLRSLELAERERDPFDRAVAHEHLATLHLERFEVAEAREQWSLACDLLDRQTRREERIFCRLGLARTERLAGEPAAALSRVGEAAAAYRSLESRQPRIATTLLQTEAAVRRDLGELERAEELAEAAVAEIEERRRAATSPSLRSTLLADMHAAFDLWVDVLARRHRAEPAAGHAARALAASEQGRARGLTDLLAGDDLRRRPGDDPQLWRRWNAVGRELARLSGRAGDAADDRILDLLTERHDLEVRIREERTGGPAPPAVAPPSATEIRAALGDGTVLLVVELLEPRSLLWEVDRHGLRLHELAPAAALTAAAERATDALATATPADDREVEADLQLLGRELLGPLAERERAERVVVVADGALLRLPWAVLPVAAGEGAPRPRLDRPFVRVPSLGALVELRRRQAARGRPPVAAAIVADPVFHPSDPRLAPPADATLLPPDPPPRLPESRGEARRLAERLGTGRPVRLLVGLEASREALLAGALGDAGIVHLATHAEIDARHPELSALLLSAVDARGGPVDGHLLVSEVRELDLEASLVVLSACRSALGRERAGEGLVGLQQAFFDAGATSLVASLWEVEDAAAAAMMDRFYAALLDRGLPPDAALADARSELAGDPRFSAPAHWAPWIVVGDWRAPAGR